MLTWTGSLQSSTSTSAVCLSKQSSLAILCQERVVDEQSVQILMEANVALNSAPPSRPLCALNKELREVSWHAIDTKLELDKRAAVPTRDDN